MGLSDFHWNSEAIASRLIGVGVNNRAQLTAALEPLGISRTTVYRAFTEDWQGEAPTCVIKAMTQLLHCSAFLLVRDHHEENS